MNPKTPGVRCPSIVPPRPTFFFGIHIPRHSPVAAKKKKKTGKKQQPVKSNVHFAHRHTDTQSLMAHSNTMYVCKPTHRGRRGCMGV